VDILNLREENKMAKKKSFNLTEGDWDKADFCVMHGVPLNKKGKCPICEVENKMMRKK